MKTNKRVKRFDNSDEMEERINEFLSTNDFGRGSVTYSSDVVKIHTTSWGVLIEHPEINDSSNN
jgi:hypothetical protein